VFIAETAMALGEQPPVHLLGLLVTALNGSQARKHSLGCHGVMVLMAEDPLLIRE
jgi:hypothetical protein